MTLEIVIEGRTRTLQLDDPAPGGGPCRFALDSKAANADVREVEPGVYSILLDGRSYEVRVEGGAEACYAAVNGRRYTIEVRDPRRLSRGRGAMAVGGRQKITSPMPGKVVRVLVKEGEEVAAGEGLIVVEAMKMQNEIRSPKAGRVIAVLVKEGAAVGGGEALVEVE